MKTALITGANRGLGYETARQLAKNGFRVIITARNYEEGQKAKEHLEREGATAQFIQMDVSKSLSIWEASQEFAKLNSRIDVLVNNAGVMLDQQYGIHELPLEIFEETLRTNATGALLVIQNFLQFMPNGSRIINVSSSLGSLNSMQAYSPAYSISKATLNAITIQFAEILAPKQIAVNAVCPGWLQTAMGGSHAPKTVVEGTATIVWLATITQSPTKQFFRDKQVVGW